MHFHFPFETWGRLCNEKVSTLLVGLTASGVDEASSSASGADGVGSSDDEAAPPPPGSSGVRRPEGASAPWGSGEVSPRGDRG